MSTAKEKLSSGAGLGGGRLEVGGEAPGFRLPSNRGEIDLADFRGRKSVVLYFVREFACMTCQMHAAALVKAYPAIQAAGAEVLAIGGGSVDDAARMAQRLRAPFPILADGSRSVYERYHVDKALAFIQRSATFAIDIDGRVAYAHRSTNPAGGLNMGELMSALSALPIAPEQIEGPAR